MTLGSPVEDTVFRFDLPRDIQKGFQAGILSMTDIELAALVMLQIILELTIRVLWHKTTAAWSGNSPTMGWIARMATMHRKITGRLLRGLGIRQRLNKMCYVLMDHTPGMDNNMLDYSSRSFTPAINLHDDSQLFAKFESLFPLPQGRPWQLVRPPK
jgi:hypothetical protein